MAEHYTRATIAVSAWCPTCRKRTEHQVGGHRKGSCLECLARLNREHDERRADPRWELYEERAAIKEYCANLPREQAQREALAEVFRSSQPKLF